MFKKTLVSLFVFCFFSFLAQPVDTNLIVYGSPEIGYTAPPDSALFFYKKGVAAFKVQNYRLADSLYTTSLEIKAHPNAYFNRASTRLQMQDRQGYCENLAFSSGMGDKEAGTLFRKHCGTMDSVYSSRINRNKIPYYAPYYRVSYTSQYMPDALIARYNANNIFRGFAWAVADAANDSLPTQNDSISAADFPGGIREMMSYIANTIKYPAVPREKGISGKVFLQLTINTLGYIDRVKVLKGIEGCAACDEEAVRVISCMPRWHPAKHNGKPVKTYYNLPLSFKILNND